MQSNKNTLMSTGRQREHGVCACLCVCWSVHDVGRGALLVSRIHPSIC